NADIVNIARTGAYNYTVKIWGATWGGDWAQGDYLTIDGAGGADQVTGAAVTKRLIAMTYTGGAGNDTLIGTKYADHLNSGTGSDTVTGGLGVDTFTDTSVASSGDVDTLVETFDHDTSLFNNYLIH